MLVYMLCVVARLCLVAFGVFALTVFKEWEHVSLWHNCLQIAPNIPV